MRRVPLAAVPLAVLAGLAACAAPEPARQRPPNFLPAAVNTLAGGFVAQRFPALDGIDRQRAAETIVSSLENGRDGQPNPWRNPDSRNSGETVPAAVRTVAGNARCRGFTHTASVAGRSMSATAVACRDPAGVWNVAG